MRGTISEDMMPTSARHASRQKILLLATIFKFREKVMKSAAQFILVCCTVIAHVIEFRCYRMGSTRTAY